MMTDIYLKKLKNTPEALREEADRLYAMQPWANARYSQTDSGNGYLLADFYKGEMRYASDRGCWFVYDGRVWQCDQRGFAAMSLAKRLTYLMSLAAQRIEDIDQRDRYIQHIKRWQTRRVREVALKDAAEVYPVTMAIFDRDPMLFNCLNGTLDLRTRTLREPSAEDYITRMANVWYNPTIRSEEWDTFTLQVAEADAAFHPDELPRDETSPGEADRVRHTRALGATAEKAAYTQKAFGYALTGLTDQECMFILYGPSSRNGKSTMVETFMAMMGDYAATAMPETIAAQRFANAHGPTEDIARLAGTRFVTLAENDRSMRLSASMIKRLTGGDSVTCRFMRENSFEFKPGFKLFMNTNHLPDCDDDTVFASGRVRVIEFERHFLPGERDLTLKQRLRSDENRSAVLNWALRGLEMIQEEGFQPPVSILASTEIYRQDTDPVTQFVTDSLTLQDDACLKTADVYRAYRIWCDTNGFEPLNSVKFRKELLRFGKLEKRRPDRGENATSCLLGYTFTLHS